MERFARRLLWFALCVLIGLGLFSGLTTVKNLREAEDRLSRARAEAAAVERQNETLRQRIAEAETPESAAWKAREVFKLIGPEDRIYIAADSDFVN